MVLENTAENALNFKIGVFVVADNFLIPSIYKARNVMTNSLTFRNSEKVSLVR